jgi:DNA polymerase
MRAALAAITEELRRLQSAGVKRVSVTDQGLAALRAAAQSERAIPAAPAVRTGPAPRPPAVAAPPAAGPRPPSLPEVLSRIGALPDKAARLAALRDLVRDDPHCRSHVRPGRQVVVGVGSPDARIFFVGEAPGAEEEVQGEPFVGPAGQLLNRMIAGMGLARGEVYIGNIMNWRPELPVGPDGNQSGNRPPTPEEMAYCLPYLLAQIDIVAPSILVALGATAAQGLLGAGTFRALGEIRGRWREFAGVPLMVTYHPSYILRNPTNRSKRLIWEDLLQVMARAGLQISEKQRGFFLENRV